MKCPICNQSKFKLRYSKINDRLFNIDGKYDIYKCSECGLLKLHQIPNDVSRFYNKEYSKRKINNKINYTVSNLNKSLIVRILQKYNYNINKGMVLNIKTNLWETIFTNQIPDEIMHIEYIENGLLLDFGCGRGEFMSLMRNAGWQVEGVEVDKESVEYCKKNGFKVKNISINKINIETNKYDAISIKHVIEHVQDFPKLMNVVKNALKIDGKVYITTPNNESLLHKLFNENWFGLEVPRHLHIFNKKNLKITMENAGFDNIKIKTTSRITKSIYYLSMHLKYNSNSNIYNSKPRVIEKIFATLVNLTIGFFDKIIGGAGDELLIIGKKIK